MTKRLLAAAAVAIAFCALWSTLVVIWALHGVLSPIATRGDAHAFMAAAGERIKRAGVGNCALALIEDGRIFDSYLHSVGAPIDDDTLFQILAHRLSAVARPQTGRNRWSFGAKSAQQEPA